MMINSYSLPFTYCAPIVFLGFLIFTPTWVQAQNYKATSEIIDRTRQFWSQEEFDKAISILEENKDLMADGYANFTYHYYLGLLYLEKKDAQNGFEILEKGMDKGYFYSFFPGRIKQINQYTGATSLLDRNAALRSYAQDTTSFKLELRLPEAYDSEREYPLLIFLHGDNSSLGSAQEEWREVKLKEPLIVAFMQSSSPVSSYSFSWPDTERNRKDLTEALSKIRESHKINMKQIIVAGFSAGGGVAIDAAVNDILPTMGFIAFSPTKPKNLTLNESASTRNISKKGYIFHGNGDYLFSDQQELITYLKASKFNIKVNLQNDMAHEYPQDFGRYLNEAIAIFLN